MGCLVAVAFAKPGQSVAYPVDDLTDRSGLNLHQVNVLGVTQRLFKENLVNSSATPKGNSAFQLWVIKQIAHGPANDEVLFDLPHVRPGSASAPLSDVSKRDH
jgi:hypothetical protein